MENPKPHTNPAYSSGTSRSDEFSANITNMPTKTTLYHDMFLLLPDQHVGLCFFKSDSSIYAATYLAKLYNYKGFPEQTSTDS
ncbi:hypothetical protein CHS0354_006111, partial [Potamilus streckersoni]